MQRFAQKTSLLHFEFAVIQGKVANDIVKDGQETRRNFLGENCTFLLDEFSGKAGGGDPLELAADRCGGHGDCKFVGWPCAEESWDTWVDCGSCIPGAGIVEGCGSWCTFLMRSEGASIPWNAAALFRAMLMRS